MAVTKSSLACLMNPLEDLSFTGISVATPTSEFIPRTCNDSSVIGPACDMPGAPCQLSQPCPNHATCINNRTLPRGYFCLCPPGFNGTACQFDHRPCQDDTCWNGGTCLNVSSSDFECVCLTGWSGRQCARKLDYCANVTCQNGGVCRGLFRDYKCECVSTSHSGRYCETIAKSLIARQTLNRSLSYIARCSYS